MKKVIILSNIQTTGKTSLAILLTITLSRLGKKVLLIDADVGRLWLARLFLKDKLYNSDITRKIYTIEDFGVRFDLGICSERGAIKIDDLGDKYDWCVIDFDVARSINHADYYIPKMDYAIIPQVAWGGKRAKFLIDELIKAIRANAKGVRVLVYPVAMKTNEDISILKWNAYDLYRAWVERKEKAGMIDGKGIPFSEVWEDFISLRDYDKEGLKVFIDKCINIIYKDIIKGFFFKEVKDESGRRERGTGN